MSEESTRQQTGFVIGGAFFLLLIACLIVVIIFGQGGKGQDTEPVMMPTPSDPGVALDWGDEPTTKGSPSHSPCDLSPVDDSQLDAGFVEDWLDIGAGIRVPTARGQGPAVFNLVPSCFAHSQMGAVLAAGTWVVLATSGYEGAAVYEQYLVKDAMGMAAIEQMRLHGTALESPVELRGWKAEVLNSDTTVVHVAYSVSSQPASIMSMPVMLRWEGDWKVVFPEGGNVAISQVRSIELDGFKRW
ncbi:MAG: hypothetical protein Q4P06_08070 [Actinomycetaceae bacterium]|nr:hypothetical protein [Actinomycetaceae bacterium]